MSEAATQAPPQTAEDLAALFPPGRLPVDLTLIPAGCAPPRRFASRFDLAMAIATLLDGREMALARTVCAYPGFATFEAFSVHGIGPPGANGVRAASWLCSVAIQDLPPEDLDRAVTEAQARLRLRPTGAVGSADPAGSAIGAQTSPSGAAR